MVGCMPYYEGIWGLCANGKGGSIQFNISRGTETPRVCTVVIIMTVIKEVRGVYPSQIPGHPTEVFFNDFVSVLRHIAGYDLKYVMMNSMPLPINLS
jgi:hypothetical protein